MIAADDFYVLELRKKRREDSLLKLRTGMNDDSWLCVCVSIRVRENGIQQQLR